MTIRESKKNLKSNLRFLRKAGEEVHLSVNYKVVNQILRENLQLFEREGLAVRKQLKTVSRLPKASQEIRIFTICEDAVLNMNDKIHQALLDQLYSQNQWLTTQELSMIPDLLKLNFINLAVMGVKNENADILQAAVSGLHQLKDLDMELIFKRFSYTEMVFSKDPTGTYTKMDQMTRAFYRSSCAKQAAKLKINETEYADQILEQARLASEERQRHIGYYLLEASPERKRLRARGCLFLCCRMMIPAIAAVVIALLLHVPWLALLFYLPLHEIIRPLLERLLTFRVPPYFMPRMEFEQIVPPEQRTLITVSALLPKPEKADSMAKHLEQLLLANANGAVSVCLLADFPESKTQTTQKDDSMAKAMKQSIQQLNQKHGNRFSLIIRPRCYIQTQQAYAGFERKRGAILQLIQYIKGEKIEFHTLIDEQEQMKQARYLLALDQDSKLFFNSAYEMITAAAHPLNQPVIDTKRGIVTKGYGILVPVIANRIDSVSQSLFSKIYTGRGGVSVYNAFCSNHYQDLFTTAVFSGKGLLHIDAFYQCLKDAIPPERVLSHDIVEGAFLRCGFLSDVEIADSNPATATGWNKRQHRWIRGDFQNILWLLPHIRNKQTKIKNPLQCFDLLLMTDNLLRALLPVFSLSLLIVSVFNAKIAATCILIALFSVMMNGVIAVIGSFIKNGFSALRQRYYSNLIPQAVNDFLRCTISLIALVTDSAIALSAAFKGIYRQFVSHRHLLEWATAEEVSFQNQNGLPAYLYHNLLSVITGAIFLLFTPSYTAWLGLLFCLCPLLQWRLGQTLPAPKPLSFSEEETEFLREQGAKMWHYYVDTCTAQEHFLPPDNLQEQPVFAVAHRTSPTNIGLMMLSTVCAEDLGYIKEAEMVVRLERTYETVQKLERYQGHLLNWYDTKTTKPLYPRYCSTVDSGNFACCLTAVKNRLKTIEGERAQKLRQQMEEELKSLDFRPLYNPHRRLFHIGYDLETQQLSNSYYDMLMSESRMTGYFAIAKRQVPKRHWGALGRTLTRFGRYVGPMSWTGTAFEYLMPPLLLPVLDNTLSYEAIRFCIACQRKTTVHDRPWGCSESGYYEFDDELNYQYKPNGINQLALKCFDKQEYIIAPYATFLALPFVPKAAIANLKRLAHIESCGRYGFYEAIDYTKRRCNNGSFEIVRSYMAHHVGMSICALENALNNNRLQKLFMQDEMAGADVLLMEKIPGGASVYNHLTEKDIPEKPRFPHHQTVPCETPHAEQPAYTAFSNKKLTCLASSTGIVSSRFGSLELYASPKDKLEQSTGFLLFYGENHSLRSITLSPHYQTPAEYLCEPGKDDIRYYSKNGVLTGEMKLSVAKEQAAEIRKIAIKNRSNHKVKCTLMLYFEPVLHTPEQFRSHPAFCKLFLEGRHNPDTGRVIFTKRTRDGNEPACMIAGFAEPQSDTAVCLRSEDILSVHSGQFTFLSPCQNTGSVPDPCCCLQFQVEIGPKETFRQAFIVAVGHTREEAAKAFETCLQEKPAESRLFEHSAESTLAYKILPSLVTPQHFSRKRFRDNDYCLADLWNAGISGDCPIITAEIRNSADTGRLKSYLEAWSLLQHYGIASDFCILYQEHGDYSRQYYGNIITVINNCGLTKKINRNNGIHLVNTVTHRPEIRKALLAATAFHVPKTLPETPKIPVPFSSVTFHKAAPVFPDYTPLFTVNGGYFTGDRFVVTGIPTVPWTHLLANEHFGTQLSNRSLGFTYGENARENRLTPWSNDPVTDHVGEKLLLKFQERYYDLIDGSVAEFSPNYALYHGKIQNFSYQITVTIHNKQKHVDIRFDSPLPADAKIAYYTLPALLFDRKHADQITGSLENGIPVIFQPFNTAFKGYMALNCSQPFEVCFDMIAFLSGQWNNTFLPPFDHCCLAAIASVTKHIAFNMSYGSTKEEAIENALFTQAVEAPKTVNQWIAATSQPALNVMVNTFLPHQVKAARLFARTGFYQCSGAYGFRDQLQDAGNLVMLEPELTKNQILLCCSRQFAEGDVLHWWHELPMGPAGVRTRCSDDLLWLPLTVARYIKATDKTDLLRQQVPFLTAPVLKPEEQEKYFTSFSQTPPDSVYEHCKRALAAVRYSHRGLALIGSCDWNDGFSAVGVEGKGESVWLTQFIAMVCEAFVPVAQLMQEPDYAKQLETTAFSCKQAVETHCWDGTHYTRAYFDNGEAIGSEHSQENKIDVLPQAFAVLCGLPDEGRNRQAILTAYETLVDHKYQLIRLFTPAFHEVNAGYISAYPVGIRENGGQYTHGVIWLIQALLQIGEAEKAYELIEYMNPARRCQDEWIANLYKAEPYAMAGDVYTHQDAPGRAGWSHYTGAAGWLYRIITEELFGIQVQNGKILVKPVLPKALFHSVCTLKFGKTHLEVRFQLNHPCSGSLEIPLDGKSHVLEVTDSAFTLI